MNLDYNDKKQVRDNIIKDLEFLIKKFGMNCDDYQESYKNIERIYDYAIKALPVKPDCHGITMLYIAHETYKELRATAERVQSKHPKKRFKIYVIPLSDSEIIQHYRALFEEPNEEGDNQQL